MSVTVLPSKKASKSAAVSASLMDAKHSEAGAASYTLVQIAEAIGKSFRTVAEKAQKGAWAYTERPVRGGRERLYLLRNLPADVQAALLLCERRQARATAAASAVAVGEFKVDPATGEVLSGPVGRSDEAIASAWRRYEAVKTPLKEEAQRRLRALQAARLLMRGGAGVVEAREIVAEQLQRDGVRGSSVESIGRWQAAVDGVDPKDWLALLVPHYSGRSVTADIPAGAWDCWKADYLRLEAPSAASCYARLCRIAKARGWTLPSLKTFERRTEREIPHAVRVLARQGEDALMRTYPAQERDRSMLAALDAVNADGHRWDVAVKFPDGSTGRPLIVGWQDLASGKILAWRLCDQESAEVVALSFGDLVRSYGIPGSAYLDNGRAFASKWITGGVRTRYRFKVRTEDPVGMMTTLLGPENIHWVTPYHGQAKPIERAWRDFCDHIAKHPAFAGAYLGNNPTNKPENYGSRAVEWADFERIVTSEIHAHNARQGRRTKLCAGRSFDDVFAASYSGITVRRATAEQLRHLLLASEVVTASTENGSVHLAGNRYWCEALVNHTGRRLVLRVDPQQLHTEAHVYAMDGTFIATAPCRAAVGFADQAAARGHQRARRQYIRASKDMLTAERRMSAAQMAAQIPEQAAPEVTAPNVVAPVFNLRGAKPPSPERFAATGTDGPSKFDLWLIEQQRRRAQESI